MKKFKQYFSALAASLLMISLVLNVLPTISKAAAPAKTAAAHKQLTPREEANDESVIGKINYEVVTENKDKVSVMNDYMNTHQALITENKQGQRFATVSVKNPEWWTFTKTRHADNTLQDVEVVKEYTVGSNKFRDIKFPINKDLRDIEFYTHIFIPAFNYDNKYTTYLQFRGEVMKEEPNAQKFQVYNKEQTALSSQMEQVYGNDAQVYTNEQGERRALITANNANLIKSFKVKINGQFVEAKVVKEDSAKNTRVYSLPIGDGKSLLETQTSVDSGAYKMDYTAYFDFDEIGIQTPFDVYNEAKTALFPDGKALFGTTGNTSFGTDRTQRVDITVSKDVKGLNYKENEQFIAAQQVSEEPTKNTKTFRIPIKNAKQLQEIQYVKDTGETQIVYFDFGKIGIPNGGTAPAPANPTPPANDNEQQLGTKTFKILAEDKLKDSYMNQYIDHTAKIIEKNGQKYAELTLKRPDYWVDIKVDGVAPTIVSENKDSKVIRVPIRDYTTDLKWDIHIIVKDVPGLDYDHNYTTYLRFDEQAATNPSNPGKPNDTIQTVGTETFKVLNEDKTKESAMARYMKNEAKIISINGQQYAEFTLLSPAYWKELKINGIEPTIVSETKDERIVRVPLASTKTDAKMEVTISVAEQNYEGHYTTYLVFNQKPAAPENPKIEVVGEKTFKVLAEDQAKVSTLAKYLKNKAKVVKVNGKQHVEFTLLSPAYWKELKINGIVPTLVSETKDEKVVRIPLEKFTANLKVAAHIVIPNEKYDHQYSAYIAFDKAPATAKPDKVVSKSNAAFTLVTSNKKTTSKVHKYMQQPIVIEKTAAGKYRAKVTLKEAKMWQNVKAQVNGKMVAVKTVSTNAKNNTKVISFDVKSARATVKMTFTLKTKITGLKGQYVNYVVLGKKAVTLQTTTKANVLLQTQNKKATSPLNKFIVKPVNVEKYSNGRYYVVATLKNASKWSRLQTSNNGKMTAVKTVKTNKKNDTKVVKFQVKSPTATVKTTFTYKDSSKKLNGKHTNYLKLSKKTTPKKQKLTTKNYQYTIVKENKKGKSVANDYITGAMSVKKDSKGKYTATIHIKNANWWKSFKTTYNGKSLQVKTVSHNKKNNTKVISFPIANPAKSKYIKANLHIVVPSIKYDNQYVVYFKIGKEQPKLVQISNRIKTKSFRVLKDKTNQTSYMDQYLVKPAQVYKKGGKQYVRLTLKKSKWWIYVKVRYGGKYSDAKVVSRNKKKNTRTIEFRVSNFKSKIYVKSHIIVPGIKYNHKYTTQIIFK